MPNPVLTYKMLNARGVDAYMGVTQLDIVECPVGSRYEYPTETLKYFKNVISISHKRLDDISPFALSSTCRLN